MFDIESRLQKVEAFESEIGELFSKNLNLETIVNDTVLQLKKEQRLFMDQVNDVMEKNGNKIHKVNQDLYLLDDRVDKCEVL